MNKFTLSEYFAIFFKLKVEFALSEFTLSKNPVYKAVLNFDVSDEKIILVLAVCRVSEMVSWHMSSGKPKRFPMSFGD